MQKFLSFTIAAAFSSQKDKNNAMEKLKHQYNKANDKARALAHELNCETFYREIIENEIRKLKTQLSCLNRDLILYKLLNRSHDYKTGINKVSLLKRNIINKIHAKDEVEKRCICLRKKFERAISECEIIELKKLQVKNTSVHI